MSALVHTISSLGLRIKEAEEGKFDMLLPDSWQACWDTYSLPTKDQDIQRVAALQVPNQNRCPSARYIRRCRKKLKERIKLKQFATIGSKERQASLELLNTRNIRKEASKEAKQILDEVRVEAAKAAATLTDLYGLARSGSKEIMQTFVDKGTINGKPVTPREFTDVMGKVFGQVAKLGVGALSDDSVEQAEGLVFEEFVAATRKRLEQNKSLGPVAVKGPKDDQ